jgi:polysaccharide biosynthesis transport protein
MSPEPAPRVNLVEILRILKRRSLVIALCTLLVPAAAVYFSLRQEKEYTATASLLFRDPGFAQTLFGSSVLSPSTDPTRDAATNVDLVSQAVVADATARALHDGATGDEIEGAVSASSQGDSNLILIHATDHSPRRAALIANTYAQQFIALRQAADRDKIRQGEQLLELNYRSLSPAERAGPRGTGIQQQLDKLQTLASIQTGNAELSQPADTPTAPSSPKPVRYGVLGALLGLLLGVGAAFLLERLDRRVREPEELHETFGRPVLGTIPQSRSLGKAGRPLSPADAEAFRMLRASLYYFEGDAKVKSVVVTSPSPGDGKSTVAWNLAATAASVGSRVLLIEADLRHPGMAAKLPIPPAAGLSELLSGHAELDDVVEQVVVQQRVNGHESGRAMDVITAGQPPPNPVDLIESARMERLIDEVQREYDFVVMDTPPTSAVSDAIPLLNQVSGVIVVGRIGATTRDAVSRLRDQLANLGVSTLGVVVNGIRGGDMPYDYYGHREPRRKRERSPEQKLLG